MSNPIDDFPRTRHTWIGDYLRQGDDGARCLHAELMAIYYQPLLAAGRTCLQLSLPQALDRVNGFFAARLSRPDYLARWAASGKPLRLWLWNGLCFFHKEEQRHERRHQFLACADEIADDAPSDPGREFDRRCTIALVHQAMMRAEAACVAEGFAVHWSIFHRRFFEGVGAAAAGRELGLEPDRALVMLRAPRRRFMSALSDLLAADGVSLNEMPRAIEELLLTMVD